MKLTEAITTVVLGTTAIKRLIHAPQNSIHASGYSFSSYPRRSQLQDTCLDDHVSFD